MVQQQQGEPKDEKVWKFVGTLDIDTATVAVGDPCRFRATPEHDNELQDWDQVTVPDGESDHDPFRVLPDGAGVLVQIVADGTYPVFVLCDQVGEVEAMMVDFAGVMEKMEAENN